MYKFTETELLKIAERGQRVSRETNQKQTKANVNYQAKKEVLTYFKLLLNIIDNVQPSSTDFIRLENYRQQINKRLTSAQVAHTPENIYNLIDVYDLWGEFDRYQMSALTDYIFTTDTVALYSHAGNANEYYKQLKNFVAHQLYRNYNDFDTENVIDLIGDIMDTYDYKDVRYITVADVYRHSKRLQRTRQQEAQAMRESAQHRAHTPEDYNLGAYVYDNMLFHNAETLALTREQLHNLEYKARRAFDNPELDLTELIQYIVGTTNKQLKHQLVQALRSLHADTNKDIPLHIIHLMRRQINGLDY